MVIDITFPGLKCRKCGCINHEVVIYPKQYAIYCKDCKGYIKIASSEQRSIVDARKRWLENHG